jgi:hypothetical protein
VPLKRITITTTVMKIMITSNHHPLPTVLIVKWLDSILRRNVLVVTNFYSTRTSTRHVGGNARKSFARFVVGKLAWQRIVTIKRHTVLLALKAIIVRHVATDSTKNM